MTVWKVSMSYEQDYFAWTQNQAAALRRAADLRINLPGVDLQHLAEEIEDLGNDTLEKIEGLVVQIVAHLLKLNHCPDANPRNHWRGEITAWRNTVRRRAKRSPTALSRLTLADLYKDAASQVRAEYGEQDWAARLPQDCPFAIDRILDGDWWPPETDGLQ